jgi:hypothetical protein
MYSVLYSFSLGLGLADRQWYLLSAMKNYVRFKAGPAILNMIREEGLNPQKIAVFAGPAGGPKWFVSAGFDRALMKSGFLSKGSERVILAGASAGGWRCLAMACKDPLDSYEKLRYGYSRNIFNELDTPKSISEAFRLNIENAVSDGDVPHILDHDKFNLAIHTVRSKGPAASENKRIQGLSLLVSAAGNAISQRAMDLFYERVIFYSGPTSPRFLSGFRGRGVKLTAGNLRQVALATGSLPYIMAGVKDIHDAPRGAYRDGGLTDYQLNQDYLPGPDAVTLFFHYQERVVPGWFDKPLSWKKPRAGVLDRVLQVFPGEDFVRMLPDGRLPDRQDFTTFVDNPSERIRRWDEVSTLSDLIGEEFLESVESSKIRRLVEAI